MRNTAQPSVAAKLDVIVELPRPKAPHLSALDLDVDQRHQVGHARADRRRPGFSFNLATRSSRRFSPWGGARDRTAEALRRHPQGRRASRVEEPAPGWRTKTHLTSPLDDLMADYRRGLALKTSTEDRGGLLEPMIARRRNIQSIVNNYKY